MQNNLSPRQEDIYKNLIEENIPVDGKPATRQKVRENYPSTTIQPRKKRKSYFKTKRKRCKCK
jgi:hypothetical protein